jgi:CHAT domain-containing protein
MPYMIRDYAISYQFSVSLFAKENTVHATNNRKMLICAPVYFKNLNNDPDRIYLSDLKGTVDEMNALQHAADSNHIETLCLKEINANETKLKSLHLSDYTYLHFATHGTVNEEHPELSKIYLYESNASDKEDGSLSAGEIYNLQLKADMVTLSACETGKGKLTKGEGVVGLTRSLVYAGAKNIIVSHWKVSDGATAFLMINFYKKALATTNNFAADLQQAKLDLIQSKTFSAPYYWAAFVLMGK